MTPTGGSTDRHVEMGLEQVRGLDRLLVTSMLSTTPLLSRVVNGMSGTGSAAVAISAAILVPALRPENL
jgi:hypothetical protein